MVATLEPDLLVSSDSQRAAQTADLVSAVCRIPVRLDARLRERALGHWEGLTREEVAQRYPDEFADWQAGIDVTRRGGETREQVAARAVAVLGESAEEGTTVFVTHSATAMALVAELLGLGQQTHVLGPLSNCHWTELMFEEHPGRATRWRVRAHNIGVPGGVVPLPVAFPNLAEDASDADA